MPRKKQERRGEKPQWRSRMKTWVARVWEADGSCSGWVDLGSDNKEIALERYERWLATGAAPAQKKGTELFAQAALRIVEKQEARGEITADMAKDRRQRLRSYALPELGHLEVGAIEPHHVAGLLDVMAERHQRSASTARNMRNDLIQILAGLIREGVLSFNAARGVALSKSATVDARPRAMLTSEQVAVFQKKRGFDEPLDLMVVFCRCVAGHRTSDIHAARWEHVERERFSAMRVRRPKTDGEGGAAAKVGKRRVRAYELVRHDIPASYRKAIRAYWEKQGRPEKGPVFPMLRDAVVGELTMKTGKKVERRGGRAGEAKGSGTSYAAALRRAVWECGIYDPLPGFDPKDPKKHLCRLQSDTAESRRLDFHSLRRGLATALAEAGIDSATRLAITGHTQESTVQKHYLGARRVGVPDAALPGFAGKDPANWEDSSLGGASVGGKSANSLARPEGFEPPTSGLENPWPSQKASFPAVNHDANSAGVTVNEPISSHVAGDLGSIVAGLIAMGQHDLAAELLERSAPRRSPPLLALVPKRSERGER